MIFQRIICSLPLNKVARIELPSAKLQFVYARTRFFNIFKFFKSRNGKCASFSLLRNLITR